MNLHIFLFLQYHDSFRQEKRDRVEGRSQRTSRVRGRRRRRVRDLGAPVPHVYRSGGRRTRHLSCSTGSEPAPGNFNYFRLKSVKWYETNINQREALFNIIK